MNPPLIAALRSDDDGGCVVYVMMTERDGMISTMLMRSYSSSLPRGGADSVQREQCRDSGPSQRVLTTPRIRKLAVTTKTNKLSSQQLSRLLVTIMTLECFSRRGRGTAIW